MKKEKKIIFLIIGVFVAIGLMFVSTYAYWRFSEVQENANVIVSKCFDLTFEEEANSNIQLLNTYPMLDSEGEQLKPYVIHLTNHCDNDLTYQMNLEVMKNTTLNEKYVKVMFNENIALLNTLSLTDRNIQGALKAYELESGTISANSTKDFSLRLWLDGDIDVDDMESMNKAFYSKVSVVGSIQNYSGRYTEDILNGTDPVLKDGLIPVTISDTGEVYKADESKEWYSYRNKRWANAVILNDETKTYQNNELIPESNIESYFVWIPRYKYQIFNDGMYYELASSVNNNAPQEIKIEFESKDVVASDGVRTGQWLTHPAFTSFDVNGIWVGKFETGYKGSTSAETAEKNINEPESIQIKPNVNSWRNIQVANAYLSSYDYKRNLDSHMMKNTEWGAVAYLQHSKYGNQDLIRLNNKLGYVTGYSSTREFLFGYTTMGEDYSDSSDDTLPWNTDAGVLASTTGNISGIYDTFGGSNEYVMGVLADKNGTPMSGRNSKYNSGFRGMFGDPTADSDTSGLTDLIGGIDFPNSKYYDLYIYSVKSYHYFRRILGDTTGEMGPFATISYSTFSRDVGSWNLNDAWFIDYRNPWFIRSNLFAFGSDKGSCNSNTSFRVVLA